MSKRELRSSFEDFVRVRKTNIALIDTVDQSALETIPLGFNNNVYWHTGHLVTVQASLLYGRAGESLPIDERFRKYFAKGTSPKDFDKARPTFDLIHKLLETMIDRTAGDLEWLYQLTYPEPVTVTSGKILKSSADAMRFLPIHEGIHLGMLSSMLKFL